MAWPGLIFILSAAIIHISYSSFLSTIDEFRRIDKSAGPSKRHGGINEPPPDVGEEEFGFDEDPSCDVVMTQCQCEDNGGGGGGGGGRGGWSKGDDSRKGSRKRHGRPQDNPEGSPYDDSEETQLETPRGEAFGSPYDNPDGDSEENLYGNPRKKAHSNPYDNLDGDSEDSLYDNPPVKAHGSPQGDPHYGYSDNSQGWDYGDSDLPRTEARGINITKLFAAGNDGGHFGFRGPHSSRPLPRKRYG